MQTHGVSRRTSNRSHHQCSGHKVANISCKMIKFPRGAQTSRQNPREAEIHQTSHRISIQTPNHLIYPLNMKLMCPLNPTVLQSNIRTSIAMNIAKHHFSHRVCSTNPHVQGKNHARPSHLPARPRPPRRPAPRPRPSPRPRARPGAAGATTGAPTAAQGGTAVAHAVRN